MSLARIEIKKTVYLSTFIILYLIINSIYRIKVDSR